MPSRNSWEKFCDAASRSPNETGRNSSIKGSDMFTPHNCTKHAPGRRPCPALITNSLRDGFQHSINAMHHFATDKKRAAVSGGSSDNREASNRVDRSHSVSTEWTINVLNG